MLVERIKIHARTPGVRGVQIDFDAPVSQRSFYRELLSRLHSELPRHVELSMTALASWCIGDRWLDKTAADEVVPMFFYMGSDKPNVLRHIRDGRSFACSRKRMAIGLAVDDKEALMTFAHGRAKRILNGRKVYLFSGRGWSKAALEQVEKELAIYDSDELG